MVVAADVEPLFCSIKPIAFNALDVGRAFNKEVTSTVFGLSFTNAVSLKTTEGLIKVDAGGVHVVSALQKIGKLVLL